MQRYTILIFCSVLSVASHTSVQAQTSLQVTPYFDSENGEGTVYVQIAGYDTDDFCYKWSGPDFLSTDKPPLKGLGFGYYCVNITDCNQVIASKIGPAGCDDGKDYSSWNCFFIKGTTCDGFGEVSYFPKEVCDVEPDVTLFASPLLPACMKDPQYQWYQGSHENGILS